MRPGRPHLRPVHLAGALLAEPLAEVEVGAGRLQIRQRHVAAILQAVRNLAGPRADRADRRVVVEPRAPRIVAQLGDASQLFATGRFPIGAARLRGPVGQSRWSSSVAEGSELGSRLGTLTYWQRHQSQKSPDPFESCVNSKGCNILVAPAGVGQCRL